MPTPTRQLVPLLLLLLPVLCSTQATEGIKECIQPVRARSYDPICDEVIVPQTIYYRYHHHPNHSEEQTTTSFYQEQSCSISEQSCLLHPSLSSSSSSASASASTLKHPLAKDVGSFVAEVIFADFAVFDVVLINAGSILESDIPSGIMTANDVRTLFPYNNELIVLRLLGHELIAALEYGIQTALSLPSMPGAYPKTAGIRYRVEYYNDNDGDKPLGVKNDQHENHDCTQAHDLHQQHHHHHHQQQQQQDNHGKCTRGSYPSHHRRLRIVDVDVFTAYCTWESIELDRPYTVLTNEFLAQGGDGYQMLVDNDSGTYLRLGQSEADSFWFHAQSTCILETPWRKQMDVEAQAANEMKLVYQLGMLPTANVGGGGGSRSSDNGRRATTRQM